MKSDAVAAAGPGGRCGGMIEVAARKLLGTTLIDVAFSTEGQVTALFGPSGSGKTSIVNMIAGLLKPEWGRICLGDQVLFDSAKRIAVPVHKRRIGYVFQDARLFPHMSVKHNLIYGRRMNRLASDAKEETHVINMLDIGPLLDRRPGKLSGGEKQRVAIGRALLPRPRLLLLDEPLASLDDTRKTEIFPYLERLRDAGIPMIYVSHAFDEVKRIADHVVHLAAGKITQSN
jgi:molybdate transport system ATP-binding protein